MKKHMVYTGKYIQDTGENYRVVRAMLLGIAAGAGIGLVLFAIQTFQ